MARVVALGSAAAVAYSSDTSPCDAVVALARDADVLPLSHSHTPILLFDLSRPFWYTSSIQYHARR